jgi:hypothetical protein
MQWHRLLALGLTGAILALFGLSAPTEASTTARSAAPTASAGARATATHGAGKTMLHGTTDDGRHFRGAFTPTSFDVVDGALMATGDVSGWLYGRGRPVPVATQTVTTQVLSANGTNLTGGSTMPGVAAGGSAGATTAAFVPTAMSCPILSLVLGPLDLDVLGLQVHLDQVVLDIVAQSGAGNLLGNLLCSVAGLLDGGTPLDQLLGQLADLLEQILGALGGLGTAV